MHYTEVQQRGNFTFKDMNDGTKYNKLAAVNCSVQEGKSDMQICDFETDSISKYFPRLFVFPPRLLDEARTLELFGRDR